MPRAEEELKTPIDDDFRTVIPQTAVGEDARRLRFDGTYAGLDLLDRSQGST